MTISKFKLLAFSLLSHSNENAAVISYFFFFFFFHCKRVFLKKEAGYDIMGANFNFA